MVEIKYWSMLYTKTPGGTLYSAGWGTRYTVTVQCYYASLRVWMHRVLSLSLWKFCVCIMIMIRIIIPGKEKVPRQFTDESLKPVITWLKSWQKSLQLYASSMLQVGSLTRSREWKAIKTKNKTKTKKQTESSITPSTINVGEWSSMHTCTNSQRFNPSSRVFPENCENQRCKILFPRLARS